jgi:hypothetical protein
MPKKALLRAPLLEADFVMFNEGGAAPAGESRIFALT